MEPMAVTPSTRADAQRNRERIITAAAQCFAHEGVECQVAEIAKHAGLGNATVFRHFPTKLDLIVAVMRRRMDELADEVERVAAGDDPGEALARVVEAIVQLMVRDAALKQLASQRIVDEDMTVCRDRMLGCIETLLGRCQAAGVVRPDVQVMDLMLMISGIAHAVGPLEASNPGVWRRYTALVTAALQPVAGAALEPAPPTLADFERAYAPH